MTELQGVESVIAGVLAAKNAGMEVKINTVVMSGENDQEILPLLDFAFKHGITIRFLELMGMGHLYGKANGKFFSKHEMLVEIARRYQVRELGKKAGETATYYRTACGHRFGIIAKGSKPFCSHCNRIDRKKE